MIADIDEVERIFATSESQHEAAIRLYQMVFPDYDEIYKIEGYPGAGTSIYHFIFQKFIEFDKDRHPDVLPGGLWMNKGFSENKKLRSLEISGKGVKVIYKKAG